MYIRVKLLQLYEIMNIRIIMIIDMPGGYGNRGVAQKRIELYLCNLKKSATKSAPYGIRTPRIRT